ncbi:MAG: hypothetical protein Q9182_005224 [Xanthomendoza sp. 2 TL-2023]
MSVTTSLTRPEKGLLSPAESRPSYTTDPKHGLFGAFSDLKTANASDKPTPAQCLAHLTLLEAFYRLREHVATTDGLYGIYDRFREQVWPSEDSNSKRTELLLKLREKRWAIHVTKAERRYGTWWRKIRTDRSSMPGQHALLGIYENFDVGWERDMLTFDKDTLPPLDYLDDCIRYGLLPLWNAGLPLATIDSCIDNRTFEYRAGDDAPDHFQTTFGLVWNSIDDSQTLFLHCPHCRQPVQIAWTTLTAADFWRESNLENHGHGFTDPDFKMQCPGCRVSITHEALRTQKFRNDCNALVEKNLPMPGTILNNKAQALSISLSSLDSPLTRRLASA